MGFCKEYFDRQRVDKTEKFKVCYSMALEKGLAGAWSTTEKRARKNLNLKF